MKRIKLCALSLFFMAIVALAPLKLAAAEYSNPENIAQDIRYLLIFKALPPHQKKERYFYEIAREITGFIDGRFFPPTGIITSEEVRYAVTKILKTRVLNKTNSHASPHSSKEGFYLLIYNPIYKICAKIYQISGTKTGKNVINYTDCESGNKYEFPVASRRSFEIYEVDISMENILRQVWEQRQKK